MEEVFMLWGGDEISIGTVLEIFNQQTNLGVLLEDIIADLVFNSEEGEITIKLVIK